MNLFVKGEHFIGQLQMFYTATTITTPTTNTTATTTTKTTAKPNHHHLKTQIHS